MHCTRRSRLAFAKLRELLIINNGYSITYKTSLYEYFKRAHCSLVQVQVRAWRLGDADWALEANAALDPRRTVFLGGVPRPLRSRMPSLLCSPSAHYWCIVQYSYVSLRGARHSPTIVLLSTRCPSAPNAAPRLSRPLWPLASRLSSRLQTLVACLHRIFILLDEFTRYKYLYSYSMHSAKAISENLRESAFAGTGDRETNVIEL